MRIWSIHPKYLDAKGLVALWRETLLAKQVLEGSTKGYKHHPQLNRFNAASNPSERINQYLAAVYDEAIHRKYNFNKDKIKWNFKATTLRVTKGQLMYERAHLLNKLNIRDLQRFKELTDIDRPDTHPLFTLVDGEVEDWEII